MKIDVTTVALVGVVGYLVWKWRTLELPDPQYDEAAQAVFWGSSFGDMAEAGANAWWSLTDWASVEKYSQSEAEQADQVARNLNNRLGWGTGSLGSL